MTEDHKANEERRLKRLLDSLGRLLNNDDFKIFMDAVVECLLKQRDDNDELTGEALIRGQGASRAYRQILGMVDQSPVLYFKLKMKESERVRRVGLG